MKNRIEISSVKRIERRNRRGFDHGAGNRIDILSRDTLCPATLLQKTAKTVIVCVCVREREKVDASSADQI